MLPSISLLRVVGWCFIFYSNFNGTFCKQAVGNENAASDLCMHFFCICPTKRTLGLYGIARGQVIVPENVHLTAIYDSTFLLYR